MKHTVMDYVPAAIAPAAHQSEDAPLPDLLWSPREVARALGVPRYKARALMAAGTFGNPHIVSNWNMHVSAAQVQAFVAARAEVAS